MAVIAIWKCDRDGSMFEDKKAADEHDKMLELADAFRQLVETNVSGITDEHAEAVGLLLARHRQSLVKACKGKPEALFEELDDAPGQQATASSSKPDGLDEHLNSEKKSDAPKTVSRLKKTG